MSKLLAALTATTGGTAIAVGGSYLLKQGNGEGAENKSQVDSGADSSDSPSSPGASGSPTAGQTGESGSVGTTPSSTAQTQQPAEEEGKKLKFKTLEEFKTNHGYKCSTSMFSGKDVDMSNLSGVGDLKSANDFLGAPTSDASQIKSCLTINGEKNTYTSQDNKGLGTFTGVWSFMNGDKGFVVVNIADTGQTASAGNLNLTGGAYLVEKATGGDQDTGKVKHKKEVTTAVEVTDEKFDKQIPKVKADSGVSVEEGDNSSYGGFMKDKEDLKKICDSTSCSGDDKVIKNELEVFEGTGQQDGAKNIAEWSDNLEWWNEMFVKSDFDLENKLSNFRGTGNKVTQTK